MTNPTRNTMLGFFAVATALMMPLAFAQTPGTPAQSVQAPPPAAKTILPTSKTETATPNASAMPSNDLSKPSTDLSAGTHAGKSWTELDTNKDGNISKAEATADVSLNSLFAKADANSDGILTADEYRAYLASSSQASVPRK